MVTSWVSTRFSTDGRDACLAVGGSGRVFLELWTMTGRGPRRRLCTALSADPAHLQALPVAGERVLLAEWNGDRPRLTLFGPDGESATAPGPGQRITLGPPGIGLALGLADTATGATELYPIGGELLSQKQSPLAVSGERLLGRGVVAGTQIVFYILAGGAAAPVVVDPAAGVVDRLVLPSAVTGAVPVCASGDTLLLAVSLGGRQSLARTSLADPARFEVLTALDRLDGLIHPMALDPSGGELALRLRSGARTRLVRHRFATGVTENIDAPPGSAGQLAGWSPTGLWLPYTTPTEPTSLWWMPSSAAHLRRGTAKANPRGHSARVETFAGPAGPIEAVVYGSWRHADRVVLALHGGPAEHWSLAYHPALQAFARAGLAVVALNPRGSTGYGRDHELAIKGAWGGPDLADVIAVAAQLAKARAPRLPAAVYGTSYGAFLGLLAVAQAPRLWSRCVAIAPFRSAAALYADAGPRVRALLDRLDGTAELDDPTGPRDLVRLAHRMRGDILVVHGMYDAVIPVRHSRELVEALRAQPGVTVTYRELAGGHQPVRPDIDDGEYAAIVRFLTGERERPTPIQTASMVD